MRINLFVIAVGAIMSAVCVGCSRSDSKVVAELRHEADSANAKLDTANAKITELQAEIAQIKHAVGKKETDKLPPKAKARLVVVRGLRPNWDYPVYEGRNILGRADELAVDIDLEPQEPMDRIWSSRQHAVILCESGAMVIEDLKSANGTYVNGKRVFPGEKRPLKKDDIIQIGAVQIKVLE